MFLAIDVGNSHTVLGCFVDGQLRRTWRISTHPLLTSDELQLKLDGLFMREGLSLSHVKSAMISSVVPPVTGAYRSLWRRTEVSGLKAAFHEVTDQLPFSFSIRANPSNQVGSDRLVNAEAAVREGGAPVIIVDSGTATTLCAVAPGRGGDRPEYLGGAILPGIELSMETLARKTAKLPSIELLPPERAIGSNTQDALRSGILLGYASMIDGMVQRFKAELGTRECRVVATGGVSALLRGIAQEIDRFDPDLTLRGLVYLHESISKR
ncbi:MAG: type III pantothenate kinase [Bacteriovoracia bacterium]